MSLPQTGKQKQNKTKKDELIHGHCLPDQMSDEVHSGKLKGVKHVFIQRKTLYKDKS